MTHMVSLEMELHSLVREDFSESILAWGLAQALASMMD